MTMEFYFDENKCKEAGYLKDDCLNTVRKLFTAQNKNGTIKETEEGIFEGTLKDFDAFGAALDFSGSKWFQNTISGWYWTVPEMESGKNRVDMVAVAKKYDSWN